MPTEPRGPGGGARALLNLEEAAPEAFARAACRLAGADHLVVVSAGPAGPRVALTTLPSGASDVALSPPQGCPSGAFEVRRPVCGLPFSAAGAFDWAALGGGPGGGFWVVFFGQGEPPQEPFGDPILARALLRRLGDAAGATAPPAEALVRLAHESKTPLVSIKGYAELLLDQTFQELDPRLRDWVRRIAAAANRMASLSRKILSEARADSAWAYHPRAVAPEAWVRRSLDEVSTLAAGRELSWSAVVAGGLPPVAIDPEAGREILLELLQNAARATPDGGRIRVRADAAAWRGGDGVLVTVEDSGVGVPPPPAGDELFGRFVTLEGVLHHHSGDFEFGASGLGLGLSLVRGVARAHGGDAWARGTGRDPSALPGAAFCIWLPAAPPGTPAAPLTTSSGRRLLVVEPDPDGRRILESALAESFRVASAASASEAAALWAGAQGEPWAACIFDPDLPDAPAVELVRQLRADPLSGTAALVCYGTRGASDEEELRRAGVDACVVKPARARVLAQRIEAVRASR